MKIKTRVVITRETLKLMLQEHVTRSFTAPHELVEFTVGRTGSIELVVTLKDNTPLLDEAADRTGVAEP